MRLLRNYMYLSGAEIVSKLLTFAAISYVARVAGPAGLGYVEFAAAILLCASLIVDQGFNPYGAREIAKAPERTGRLVSEIVVVRYVLALVAYAAMVGFALLLGSSGVITQLVLIYGLSLLAMPLLLQWVFQGHDRMALVGIFQMIRQGIFALVVFAFVRDQSQIWVVAAGEVAGVCAAAAFGVWMYRRQFGNAGRATLAFSRQLFREGVPIGLSQMFWMLRMFGATVLVGLVASAEDVGFFGAAMRVLVALHAFVWLYYSNLLPSMARAWQRGDGTFASLITGSLRTVTWICSLGGVLWILGAPAAATALYGSAFAPTGFTLQWLAGVCIVAAVSGHYRYGLIAAGHQTAEMLTSALGAAIVVVLLPVGYAVAGLNGAAAALVVAEVGVWVSAWWAAHGRLGLDWHLELLIRPLAATTIALGVWWALPEASLGAQATAALAVLAALAFTLDGSLRRRGWQLVATWRPRVRPGEAAT